MSDNIYTLDAKLLRTISVKTILTAAANPNLAMIRRNGAARLALGMFAGNELEMICRGSIF